MIHTHTHTHSHTHYYITHITIGIEKANSDRERSKLIRIDMIKNDEEEEKKC